MTDHIRLWYLRFDNMRDDDKVLGKTLNKPAHWLCTNPDFDLENMKLFASIGSIHFWRTDRELTNCMRCLVTLKKMEDQHYE